jgi:hypothetical protein
MFVILAVAMLGSVGVLGWRRAQFLALAKYFRDHATYYARAEAQHALAVAEIAKVEHEVAEAKPPSVGSDDGARRAYMDYLSSLKTKVKIARSSLDVYERYHAIHRYANRLAAKYERAATRPWVGVAAGAPDDWLAKGGFRGQEFRGHHTKFRGFKISNANVAP